MNNQSLSNVTNTTTAGPSTTLAPTGGPLIDVDATTSCTFCPDGSLVSSPDKLFINNTISCSDLEAAFRALEDSTVCFEILEDFAFDPFVYCDCPMVNETGICSLCPSGNIVVDPDIIINNATCQEYADLSAATLTLDYCQDILKIDDIQEACCNLPTEFPGSTVSNDSDNITVEEKPSEAPSMESIVEATDEGEEMNDNGPSTRNEISSARVLYELTTRMALAGIIIQLTVLYLL